MDRYTKKEFRSHIIDVNFILEKDWTKNNTYVTLFVFNLLFILISTYLAASVKTGDRRPENIGTFSVPAKGSPLVYIQRLQQVNQMFEETHFVKDTEKFVVAKWVEDIRVVYTHDKGLFVKGNIPFQEGLVNI